MERKKIVLAKPIKCNPIRDAFANYGNDNENASDYTETKKEHWQGNGKRRKQLTK